MKPRIFLLAVVCASAVTCVLGNSAGAPAAACNNMYPAGHSDSVVAGTEPPYTLTVTNQDGSAVTQYNGGEKLRVTITPTGGQTFKGFLVKARRADTGLDQNEAMGTFAIPAGQDGKIQERCVSNSSGNALTHKNANTFSDPLVLLWTAPSPAGHLEFLVTVVRSFDNYWPRIKAQNLDLLRDPNAGELSGGPEITVSAGDALDLSDCESNTNKGCYTRPSKCTKDCDVAVTWMANGNSFDFQMSSKEDYVALGFSSDKNMGDDSVIECIRDTSNTNNEVQAGNSENIDQDNFVASPYFRGISSQTNGYADGEVRCRFTHDGNGEGDRALGGDNSYYLFLASGKTSGGSKSQHTDIPLISDELVQLNKFEFVAGSLSKPWLIKIHGALMMIAWIACASTAIMMARYYKEVWPNSTLCAQKVWFAIHRALMITVVLLTIGGFVVIFIHVKDWSDLDTADPTILRAHPYLGVIVTALALINPIMALFRPHPGTPNRVYFNWAHWGVGTLAHVVSIFAVFLGLSLPSAEGVAPGWLIWVMVGFVAFHVICDIILEIHKCSAKNNKEENQPLQGGMDNDGFHGSNTMEMQQMGQSSKSESNGSTFMQILLAVYILVVVALTATLTIVVLIQ